MIKKVVLNNCCICQHNDIGICDLTDKEIPQSYVMRRNQGYPRFCPIKEELENERKRICKSR